MGLYCGLGLLLGTLKVIYLFIIVFLLKVKETCPLKYSLLFSLVC